MSLAFRLADEPDAKPATAANAAADPAMHSDFVA
jgi:hypothetical protein